MADDIELKKAESKNPVGQEFRELDETVIRFVSHDEDEEAELVSPTVHAIMPIETGKTLIGTTVAGSIKIQSMIGSGGMSSVYRGLHASIGREVAVKVMHAHLLYDDNAILRFNQEAQAVGRLDHPNIVKVHDFKAGGDGNSFLIMDLVEGVSLADAITEAGTLTPERAIDIFTQACEGLQHAHSKGIIHRDLKPSNIMLVKSDNGSEQVKVLDFGIAKILPQEGDARMKLTQTGEVFGSPLYMSPEQCMGKAVDHRSDIYSMGCLIYEALTGKPPLEGANAFDTFFKHTTEMPQSIKMWRPDFALAREFDAIILKAMAKDPKDRYQSMTQLRNDLARLDQSLDRGWLGRVSDDVELARRRFGAQRKRTLKSIVAQATVVLLLAGTAGGSWYYYNNILAAQSMTWDQLYVNGQDSFDRGDYSKASQQFELALQKAKLDTAKVLPVLRELVDMQIAQGNLGSGNYEARLAATEKERDETISLELDDLIKEFNQTAAENTPGSKAKLEELANDICDKTNLLVNPGVETRKKADSAWKAIIAQYEGPRAADQSVGYARSLHGHAGNLLQESDLRGALAYYSKATEVKKKLAAKDATNLAGYITTLNWVGQIQEQLGELDNAERTFKECIAAARHADRSALATNNSKIAFGKFRLAEFYQYAKKEPKIAKATVGEAIRIYESLETQEPEQQANCYALLGTIQLSEGNLEVAQENFQRAHDLFQALHQKKSSFWLETLKGLAECKYARGDYAGAEPLYRRALAVGMHFANQYSPTIDRCMSRLNEIATKRGASVDDSMKLGLMRLKLDQTKHGMNNAKVLHDYLNLYDLARQLHEKKMAEEFLDKAEAVAEKTGGPGSWDWAKVTLKRGQFNFDNGKAGDGEAAFEDIVDALEKLKVTSNEQKQLVRELSFQVNLRMKSDPELAQRIKKLM
jgi:outer membrane protein assembly factor BamD (BamD/ComL family)